MDYMSTWFSSSQLRNVVMEERATELVQGVPSQQVGSESEYNRHGGTCYVDGCFLSCHVRFRDPQTNPRACQLPPCGDVLKSWLMLADRDR